MPLIQDDTLNYFPSYPDAVYNEIPPQIFWAIDFISGNNEPLQEQIDCWRKQVKKLGLLRVLNITKTSFDNDWKEYQESHDMDCQTFVDFLEEKNRVLSSEEEIKVTERITFTSIVIALLIISLLLGDSYKEEFLRFINNIFHNSPNTNIANPFNILENDDNGLTIRIGEGEIHIPKVKN